MLAFPRKDNYSLFFPAAFAFAHLAFAAAAILALEAALIFRRFFGAASALAPFALAHRAFCAAAIAALVALDRLYTPRRLTGAGAAASPPPAMELSCAVRLSISSL